MGKATEPIASGVARPATFCMAAAFQPLLYSLRRSVCSLEAVKADVEAMILGAKPVA